MVIKTMPGDPETEMETPKNKDVSNEVLVIAQEIQIVKALAGNDLSKRHKQLKRLRKWLKLRTRSTFPFTLEDFRRMWKGLYYMMWMSDKPLIQEDLAEQFGKLLLCFEGNLNASTNFFGGFLFTMYHQWFGVDQWRIDKFMMLVRRMLRYMFVVLKDASWSHEGIELFNKQLKEYVFADSIGASGLTMHILDVYCEELAKVANTDISGEKVGELIRPFVEFYCTQRDFKLTSHCRTRIFYHLLYQSKLGREYTEKYNAWKDMGFPTAHINDLERVDEEDASNDEIDTAETKEKVLDPRAGNVNVYMPELPVDVTVLIQDLETFLYKRDNNMKRVKQFKKIIEIFKTFQNGEFPLGIKKMPRINLDPKEEVIEEKIDDMDQVEDELYGVGRKLKQLNKRKRRKLLSSLNFEDANVENFDNIIEKAIPTSLPKKRKRKDKDHLMNSWIEEDIDEDLLPKAKQAKIESNDLNELSKENQAVNEIAKKKDQKHETVSSLSEQKQINKNKKLEKKNEINSEKGLLNATTEPTHKQILKKTVEAKSIKASTSVSIKAKDTNNSNEWQTPLKEGEIEYFIPSRKLQLKKANNELVLNPLAVMKKKKSANSTVTPHKSTKNIPKTPDSTKRVKIALKHNTEQKPSEYIRQVMSSPNVPYDANKKPGKGLLKPNSVPSPINPFYKKKIGLRFLNDTM